MNDEQQEIINKSHRYFSNSCFNAVWDLIDKSTKTLEDIEKMIHLTHTSFWHWTQVPEVTPTNLSIGYWQLSRVYAIAGKGEESLYYGKKCIEVSIQNNLEPFYVGYGHEATARAYQILKKTDFSIESKKKAMEYCDKVTEMENKTILEVDIDSIKD